MSWNFGEIKRSDPVKISYRELSKLVIERTHIRHAKGFSEAAPEWQCFCPYHADKHPSMFINPDRFVYHCFQCGSAGSLYQLYEKIKGTKLLADLNLANDSFSMFAYENSFRDNFEEEDLTIPDPNIQVAITEGESIPVEDSKKAMSFLRKRGISLEVARSMKMSYMELGRINHTFFKERLLIPIFEKNQLLSIEGRAVTPQDRKVIYPKDSTVSTLYDIDSLNKEEPLYVVEGLMDLAVLRSDLFFKNSTCLFGAGISRRQVYLLNQFENIVMIPDADEAGRKSLQKLHDTLSKPFKILDVPKMNNVKDVGDIPQKTSASVESLRKRGWGRPSSMRDSSSLILCV